MGETIFTLKNGRNIIFKHKNFPFPAKPKKDFRKSLKSRQIVHICIIPVKEPLSTPYINILTFLLPNNEKSKKIK